MFGMFGIGPMELVIVLVMGAVVIGAPLVIVLVLLLMRRSNPTGTSSLYEQLRRENEQLQKENEQLRAQLNASKDQIKEST